MGSRTSTLLPSVSSSAQAQRITFHCGRLDLSVTLPPRLAAGLRHLRRRLRAVRSGESAGGGTLTVLPEPPQLHITRRDPGLVVTEFREFCERRLVASKGEVEGGATLAEKVASLRWYHSIELPDGIVTPGLYDHRPLLRHYGLPDDLDGRRALDVGTADGFWAFELERRGAEVVATDVERVLEWDFPAPLRTTLEEQGLDRKMGDGFNVAHAALWSKVKEGDL